MHLYWIKPATELTVSTFLINLFFRNYSNHAHLIHSFCVNRIGLYNPEYCDQIVMTHKTIFSKNHVLFSSPCWNWIGRCESYHSWLYIEVSGHRVIRSCLDRSFTLDSLQLRSRIWNAFTRGYFRWTVVHWQNGLRYGHFRGIFVRNCSSEK